MGAQESPVLFSVHIYIYLQLSIIKLKKKGLFCISRFKLTIFPKTLQAEPKPSRVEQTQSGPQGSARMPRAPAVPSCVTWGNGRTSLGPTCPSARPWTPLFPPFGTLLPPGGRCQHLVSSPSPACSPGQRRRAPCLALTLPGSPVPAGSGNQVVMAAPPSGPCSHWHRRSSGSRTWVDNAVGRSGSGGPIPAAGQASVFPHAKWGWSLSSLPRVGRSR